MMAFYNYYNPYSGKTFLGFFEQLGLRLIQFFQGQLSWDQLAADEIQILVLVGVAASSALVGTFLVLRRMTMLANSLSHTILIGIFVAFILTSGSLISHDEGHSEPINIHAMIIASLVMGIVTTFLTEFLTKTAKLQEDASIGIVFTSLFALGIVLVTLVTRNAHIGTEVVMGNVDALHIDDCKLVYTILAMNVGLVFLFFKQYQITTFDPGLAKALGFSTVFFNYLLMVQTSATAIGAFRAVGVLMFLAFITGPVLAARLLTHHLKKLILLSIALGAIASITGVAVARHMLSVHDMPLSTGGIVVCIIALQFLAIHAFQLRRSSRQLNNSAPKERQM